MRNRFLSCALLLGLLMPLPAAAADAVLAAQVLALDREIHALEAAAAPAARLHIFIGSTSETLRLRKLSLRIDDREPRLYEYAEPEWQALAAGGLHPALSLALPPGPHRLRVELSARTLDPGPTDPRAVERLDRVIELPAGSTVIELEMTQQRFNRSGLAVRESTGSAPWSRAAQFWLDADRPWLAARLLSRLPEGGNGELLGASLGRFAGRGATDANAAPIDAFNAAALAAAQGDTQALALIANGKARGSDAWALRDHANLLLGYAHLRRGEGEAALEVFGRVRSPGPHGNAALLGFGWAFLVQPAVAGTLAPSPALAGRPAFAATVDRRVINARVDADATKERRKALERALVPWVELIGLDPLDLDAQEGALAVAWALAQLDTGAQSHLYYERAAHQLETARARLDLATKHVSSGAAADVIASGQRDAGNGWRAWLADLPYADDTGYLKYLLADSGYIAALDAYRGARLLLDELDACTPRLAALPADTATQALATRVQTTRAQAAAAERAARDAFERRALELLATRKSQTERYLAEARFAMARNFDSAPPPETELKRDGDRS